MPAKSDNPEDRDQRKTAAMVDRLLKQLPGLNEPNPPPAPPAPRTPTGSRPAIRPITGQRKVLAGTARSMPSPLAVWGRTLLVLLLAIGVSQWPYARDCGFALYGYTAVLAALVAAGVWAGLMSWRARLGVAHVIAVAVTVFGLALATNVVLPRVGYAAWRATWGCG